MKFLAKRDPGKIRLLLVDDHPLVREGIRSCLASHSQLEIVGEAADGREALSRARSLKPDIVLMDINLPALGGLEATQLLRAEVPQTKVLVLTVHNNKEYVLRIVRAGALGYVLKDTSPEELVRAIERVSAGEAFFSRDVAQFILDDYVTGARNHKVDPITRLSGRECQVLGLVAHGCSSKEIGNRLGLSVRTVETHRARIMRKLNVRNAAALTKLAIARGIIRLE